MEEGVGVSRFSVRTFIAHSAENFRWGTLLFQKFFGKEKTYRKKGVSRFFIGTFHSHSAEKLGGANLFMFWKISGMEKTYGKRRELFDDSPSEKKLSNFTEKFRRAPFSV